MSEEVNILEEKLNLVKHLGEYFFKHSKLLTEAQADSILAAMQPILTDLCSTCGDFVCASEYCPIGMYAKNTREALAGTWLGWTVKAEDGKDV